MGAQVYTVSVEERSLVRQEHTPFFRVLCAPTRVTYEKKR